MPLGIFCLSSFVFSNRFRHHLDSAPHIPTSLLSMWAGFFPSLFFSWKIYVNLMSHMKFFFLFGVSSSANESATSPENWMCVLLTVDRHTLTHVVVLRVVAPASTHCYYKAFAHIYLSFDAKNIYRFSHQDLVCVSVHVKTEDFLHVFMFVDGKVCWFLSNSIFWFAPSLRHLSDVVVNVVLMRGDSGAIFVSNNLKHTVHTPYEHEHEQQARIYLFVRCLVSHHNSRSFGRSGAAATVAAVAAAEPTFNKLARSNVRNTFSLFV